MTAPRIGLVVNAFPTVSETFIFNKVTALRAAGLDVHVVAGMRASDEAFFADRMPAVRDLVSHMPLADGYAWLAPRVGALVARHPRLALTLWRRSIARYGRNRRAVRAYVQALPIAAGRYDVVHFEYSGLATVFADALPLLRPARLVTSCRGTAEQVTPLVRPGRAEALRAVFGCVDRVHCVSESMLRAVGAYGLDPRKGFVNPPAIDAERFRRTSPYAARAEGPFRLASTGRLVWIKGYEYALLAVRELRARGLDVAYDVVGAGPAEDSVRFAVRDLGLEGAVRLHGRRSAVEVRQVLEQADVVLLPSVGEGLSNAALEAMAMEIPVVSTSVGGMPEVITSGVDGVLVPSRDPARMADAIAMLLRDPAERRRMGAAGRQRVVQAFGLEQQCERFVAFYRALVARTDAPPDCAPALALRSASAGAAPSPS